VSGGDNHDRSVDDRVRDLDADARMGRAVYGILAVVAASVIGWWFINFANAPEVSEARVVSQLRELEAQLEVETSRGNASEVKHASMLTDIEALRLRVGEIDASIANIREIVSRRNTFDIEDYKRERRILDQEFRALEIQIAQIDKTCSRLEQRIDR
jgi:hypothetical protein